MFEKMSAFIFLLLLIGMIGFLTYVPIPDESKQVVLIIIGGLMTTAATALPKMFGVDDSSEKEKLKTRITTLETEYRVLKEQYDELTATLVRHHVIADNNAGTDTVLGKSHV